MSCSHLPSNQIGGSPPAATMILYESVQATAVMLLASDKPSELTAGVCKVIKMQHLCPTPSKISSRKPQPEPKGSTVCFLQLWLAAERRSQSLIALLLRKKPLLACPSPASSSAGSRPRNHPAAHHRQGQLAASQMLPQRACRPRSRCRRC